MRKDISPIDRAMQILREIEMGESVSTSIVNRKTTAFKKAKAVESNTDSEEGPVSEPEPIQPPSPPVSEPGTDTGNEIFSMDSENILRGIIYSEILSKPKALRRGRWY